MTDSDSDELSNAVFSFQNQTQKVHAKGPHGISNTSSLSFRNNVLTSTMNTPWNVVKPRYAESVCDPRSSYQRSMHQSRPSCTGSRSVYNARGESPSRSVYYQRSGSPTSRSVYNTRGGSPTMSMRSFRTVDTNATVSAVDIVSALQTTNFNKFESRLIKEAIRKYMKKKARRRVEKRRNVRKFMKGGRRKSGGDSGDIASDSSLSSDGCQSYRSSRTAMSSVRSTKTDFTDIRRLMTDSNMYRDCTNDFRRNSFRGLCPSGQPSLPHQSHNMPAMSLGNRSNSHLITHQDKYTSSSSRMMQGNRIDSSMRFTQKERFQNGVQLPSQRFQPNMLPSTSRVQGLQIVDEDSVLTSDRRHRRRESFNSSIDNDIFPENSTIQNSGVRQEKRNLDDDDLIVPTEKRSKLSSPKTNKSKPSTPKTKSAPIIKKNSKDFVFAKPQLPISKLVKAKTINKKKSQPTPRKQTSKSPKEAVTKQPQTGYNPNNSKKPQNQLPAILTSSEPPTDILISKSAQPLDEEPVLKAAPAPNTRAKPMNGDQSVLTQNTTDLSMRPSFIKRKLFSQTADIQDKNSSSDSLQAASPSNLYSAIQKEKNRTRKIVASQSCMSRDILGDESNFLDLIHKIVPPDRMSVTTATNRTEIQTSRSYNKTSLSNTDHTISNLMTTSKDDDVSDSFTDEEIFNRTVIDSKQNVTQKVCNKEDKANKNHKNYDAMKQNGATKTTKPHLEQPKSKPVTRKEKQIEKEHSPAKANDEQIVPKPNQDSVSKPRNQQKTNHPELLYPGETAGVNKTVRKCVKLFWDSDFESDIEYETRTLQKNLDNCKVGVMTKHVEKNTTKKPKQFLDKEITNSEICKGVKDRNENLFDKIPRVSIEIGNIKPCNKLGSNKNEKDIPNPHTECHKNKSLQANASEKAKTTKKTKSRKNELPEKENTVPKNVAKKTLQKQINDKLTEKNKANVCNENPKMVIQNNKVSDNNKIIIQKKKVGEKNRIVTKGSTILKANNTIQSRLKLNKEPDKSVDESSDAHYLSLRSRDVDLSTSLKTNSNTSKDKKKPAVKKAKSIKNLKENTNNDKSLPSDPSFILELNQPPHLTENTKYFPVKNRKSNVSFTLRSDNIKSKIAPKAASRNTRIKSKFNLSRELVSLLNTSTIIPSSTRRTPIPPNRYIIQY